MNNNTFIALTTFMISWSIITELQEKEIQVQNKAGKKLKVSDQFKDIYAKTVTPTTQKYLNLSLLLQDL